MPDNYGSPCPAEPLAMPPQDPPLRGPQRELGWPQRELGRPQRELDEPQKELGGPQRGLGGPQWRGMEPKPKMQIKKISL